MLESLRKVVFHLKVSCFTSTKLRTQKTKYQVISKGVKTNINYFRMMLSCKHSAVVDINRFGDKISRVGQEVILRMFMNVYFLRTIIYQWLNLKEMSNNTLKTMGKNTESEGHIYIRQSFLA